MTVHQLRRHGRPAALLLCILALGGYGCGAAGSGAACATEPCGPAPRPSPRATLAEVRVAISGMRETVSRLTRSASACPTGDQTTALLTYLSTASEDLDRIEAQVVTLGSDSYRSTDRAAERDVEMRVDEVKEQARRQNTRLELVGETVRRCR